MDRLGRILCAVGFSEISQRALLHGVLTLRTARSGP